MVITIKRKIKTGISCIGELWVNDRFECWTAEAPDRELHQHFPLAEITRRKLLMQTAIPTGRYQVTLSWSDRWKMYMPLVMEVPGFANVRLYADNVAATTDGCIRLGCSTGINEVYNSRMALRNLLAKLKGAERTEKITMEIW